MAAACPYQLVSQTISCGRTLLKKKAGEQFDTLDINVGDVVATITNSKKSPNTYEQVVNKLSSLRRTAKTSHGVADVVATLKAWIEDGTGKKSRMCEYPGLGANVSSYIGAFVNSCDAFVKLCIFM